MYVGLVLNEPFLKARLQGGMRVSCYFNGSRIKANYVQRHKLVYT